MKLTWNDPDEIAWALRDKFPDMAPLSLSFPKLHQLVCGLDEFTDDPADSNERILETIQMAWLDETR